MLKAHVVGVIDILGMGSRLLQLDEAIDTNDEGRIRALQTSVGLIVTARQLADKLLEEFYKAPHAKAPNEVPSEVQELVKTQLARRRRQRVELQFLGDSIVGHVPLYVDENFNSAGIASLIWLVGSMQLLCLQAGYLTRGGIDLGYGMVLPNGELLSAAQVRAHWIESHEAVVPRTILGSLLKSALTQQAAQRPRTLTSALAETALELTVADTDGRVYVDYFCPMLLSMFGKKLPDMLYGLAKVIARFGQHPDADPSIAQKQSWVVTKFSQADLRHGYSIPTTATPA